MAKLLICSTYKNFTHSIFSCNLFAVPLHYITLLVVSELLAV